MLLGEGRTRWGREMCVETLSDTGKTLTPMGRKP